MIRDRPDLADESLERLAQVFRYTLRKSDQEWVTLGEELDFVEAYLAVEQARFGERLKADVRAGEEARRAAVPAMCVQPLVENAIRHGVAAQEGVGVVRVTAEADESGWWVEVADNGPGFPAGYVLHEGNGGHGLPNARARLKGCDAGRASLEWERRDGETRVVMRLSTSKEPAHARVDRG